MKYKEFIDELGLAYSIKDKKYLVVYSDYAIFKEEELRHLMEFDNVEMKILNKELRALGHWYTMRFPDFDIATSAARGRLL